MTHYSIGEPHSLGPTLGLKFSQNPHDYENEILFYMNSMPKYPPVRMDAAVGFAFVRALADLWTIYECLSLQTMRPCIIFKNNDPASRLPLMAYMYRSGYAGECRADKYTIDLIQNLIQGENLQINAVAVLGKGLSIRDICGQISLEFGDYLAAAAGEDGSWEEGFVRRAFIHLACGGQDPDIPRHKEVLIEHLQAMSGQ